MTVQNYTEHGEAGERAPIGVWFCGGCKCFHIRAGKVLLTFDPDEFAEFSDSIFDCYSRNLRLADFSAAH